MLEADLILFQVLEDEADNADNLLTSPEIEDLGNVLNHVELEVLEHRHSILVVGENPEAAANIVGNLGVSLARLSQEFLEDVEATVFNEDSSKLVNLEKVHQAVGVGLARHVLVTIASLKEVIEEVLGIRALFLIVGVVAAERDELGEGVGSQVTVGFVLRAIRCSHQVAGEYADAVALLGADSALLQVSEKSDARSIVLNDAIDHGKGPPDEFLIATDRGHNVHESLNSLLSFFLMLTLVKELPL